MPVAYRVSRVSRYPAGRRVLATDAIDDYKLFRTRLSRELVDQNPVLSLWHVIGDVELDDLVLDVRAASAPTSGLSWAAATPIHGFLITGSLRVRGPVHNADPDAGLALYVLGDLDAQSVAVTGIELVVRGNAQVADVLCCAHGGEAWFHRDVSTRLLISDDFSVWIAGRLTASVLDTPRTRVGLLGPEGMRAVPGEAPPAAVLTEQVLVPDESGSPQRFAFGTLRAALLDGVPVLAPELRSGTFDITTLRELRWLEAEARAAMAESRYLSAAEMLRAAMDRGAPASLTRLRVAEALYHAHHVRGDIDGLREALRMLNETLEPQPASGNASVNGHGGATDVSPESSPEYPIALIRRAAIMLQLDEHDESAFERAWRDLDHALHILQDGYQSQTGLLAETYSLMGRWLYARRRYEECLPYLQQSLSLDGNLGPANGDLARALWLLDREADAVPYATNSLRLNPTDDFLWFVRGKCYQKLGERLLARSDLQTYLELHPNDEFTIEALVELSLDMAQPQVALEAAARFGAEQPDDVDVHARIGRLLYTRGMHSEAVPFLRRVVELDPDHLTATGNLAVSLTMLGGDTRALEAAVRAMEISPGAQHRAWVRGECYRLLKDPERAEADLRRYVERNREAAVAIASLSAVLGDLGRHGEARVFAERAREMAPDDETVSDLADHRPRAAG
jgi:tetratricopeptide (TPR) repeat protein